MNTCKTDHISISGTVIMVVIALGLGGCVPAQESESAVEEVPVNTASVERGKLVYDTHCYSCHLQGQGGLAPALNNKPLPKFMIRLQVRQGVGSMPSFGEREISGSELSDLADYVVALRHHSH